MEATAVSTELATFKAEFKAFTKQSNSENDELRSTVQTHISEMAGVKDVIKAKQAELEKKEADIRYLNEEIEKLEEIVKGSSTDISKAKLKKEYRELKRLDKERETELRDLKLSFGAQAKELKKLDIVSKDVDGLKNNLNAVKQQFGRALETIQIKMAEIKEKDQEIAHLKQQIVDLQREKAQNNQEEDESRLRSLQSASPTRNLFTSAISDTSNGALKPGDTFSMTATSFDVGKLEDEYATADTSLAAELEGVDEVFEELHDGIEMLKEDGKDARFKESQNFFGSGGSYGFNFEVPITSPAANVEPADGVAEERDDPIKKLMERITRMSRGELNDKVPDRYGISDFAKHNPFAFLLIVAALLFALYSDYQCRKMVSQWMISNEHGRRYVEENTGGSWNLGVELIAWSVGLDEHRYG